MHPWWRSLSVGLAAVVLVGVIIFPWWAGSGYSSEIVQMSQVKLLTALEQESQLLILDVRTEDEFAAGHIPGAVNIHFRDLPNHLDTLRAQNPSSIVVYCETGIRAGIAERTQQQAGFKTVLHLEGHMRAWRSHDLPVVRLE